MKEREVIFNGLIRNEEQDETLLSQILILILTNHYLSKKLKLIGNSEFN